MDNIKDLANNLHDSGMLLQLAALDDSHKLALLNLTPVQDYLLGVQDFKKLRKSNVDFFRNRHYQMGFNNQQLVEQAHSVNGWYNGK